MAACVAKVKANELYICLTCNLSLGEVGGEAPFLRGFGAKVKANFLMSGFLNGRNQLYADTVTSYCLF